MTITPSSPASTLLDERLDERERVALAAGDRAAWERQYRELHGPLYGYCLKLAGDEATALDLVQETFARAMRRCRERGTPDGLRAYLYTSARNQFIDDVRRRSRTDASSAEDVASELPDDEAALRDVDPDVGAVVAEQRDDVRAALATLPDRQRQALALCDMEGCSYAQVGEALDLNENAVAQLVFRARGRLRLALRLRQVDESSLPEGCRSNLEPISRMLDGALKGSALEQLEQHLAACEACSGVRGDFELVQRRYRAFAPLLPLGADEAWAGMLERTSASEWLVEGAAPADRRWTRRGIVVLGTLVLLLLLAGGIGAAVLVDEDDAAPVLRAAATSDDEPVDDEAADTEANAAKTPGTRRGRGAADDEATGEASDDGQQAATGDDDEDDGGRDARPSSGGGGAGTTTRPPRPGRPAPGAGDGTGSGDGTSGETQQPDPAPTSDPVQPEPDPTPPPPPPTPGPANLVANSVVLGNDGRFAVSISNTGESAAGGFSVRVSVGNRPPSYGSSSGIAAGSSTTVYVTPGSLCEGTITFTATVDVYGAIAESSEGDNTASGSTQIIC